MTNVAIDLPLWPRVNVQAKRARTVVSNAWHHLIDCVYRRIFTKKTSSDSIHWQCMKCSHMQPNSCWAVLLVNGMIQVPVLSLPWSSQGRSWIYQNNVQGLSCRLVALLWHQMVDHHSTWDRSDNFCRPGTANHLISFKFKKKPFEQRLNEINKSSPLTDWRRILWFCASLVWDEH